MLTVTDAASGYVADLLVNARAPDEAVSRFVLEGQTVTPTLGRERPGDTTFDREGSPLLVLDAHVAERLTDRTLDVRATEDGLQLVLL